MNSARPARDRAHRIATRTARSARCLVCGALPSVPAHYRLDGRSGHRGMGSGKAGWDVQEWVPLCVAHHDLIDGRTGVSSGVEVRRAAARKIIAERAPQWWAAQGGTNE